MEVDTDAADEDDMDVDAVEDQDEIPDPVLREPLLSEEFHEVTEDPMGQLHEVGLGVSARVRMLPV